MSPTRVHIVGAGFSGLTVAYFLKKSNPDLALTIHERADRVGGLLQTTLTPQGIVESGANAILDSAELRALAIDIEIELQSANPKIRRAYFWRNKKLRAWPLTWFESARFGVHAVRFMADRPAARPVGAETVEEWGSRVFGSAFARYILDPVLGGIYAAQASVLSARVVMARLFEPRDRSRPSRKIASVAPPLGMHELCRGLARWLVTHGAELKLGDEFALAQRAAGESVIFCGSLQAAQAWLTGFIALQSWTKLQMAPVSSTTLFFDSTGKRARPVRAFGVLFPRAEARPFLGVLFNSQIFPRGARYVSETWISNEIAAENPGGLDKILTERKYVFSSDERPVHSQTSNWPSALPLYGEPLREFLTVDWPPMKRALAEQRVYLHGNYLGKLGLSGLLSEAKKIAAEVGSELRSRSIE